LEEKWAFSPLRELLKKWPKNASQEVWPFDPWQVPNVGQLHVTSGRYALSKVSSHSSWTRITCSMNDERRDLQRGNLFNHGRLLNEVSGIFPENPIDLEIDMQTIHKKLSS
jgi:hypothetical protein